MGKTKRHEKEWGSKCKPHHEDYDMDWEETERDYTVQDFFRGCKDPRIYCPNCGYSDIDDLTPIATHSRNKTMCPGCGGPATVVYD